MPQLMNAGDLNLSKYVSSSAADPRRSLSKAVGAYPLARGHVDELGVAIVEVDGTMLQGARLHASDCELH
jgi:hypothetical protein